MKKFKVRFGNLNPLEDGRYVVVVARDTISAESYAVCHYQNYDEYIQGVDEIKE